MHNRILLPKNIDSVEFSLLNVFIFYSFNSIGIILSIPIGLKITIKTYSLKLETKWDVNRPVFRTAAILIRVFFCLFSSVCLAFRPRYLTR